MVGITDQLTDKQAEIPTDGQTDQLSGPLYVHADVIVKTKETKERKHENTKTSSLF